MAVALIGVVELVGIGDLGQEWAGILGERVEEDSVDDQANGLQRMVSGGWSGAGQSEHSVREGTNVEQAASEQQPEIHAQVGKGQLHLG